MQSRPQMNKNFNVKIQDLGDYQPGDTARPSHVSLRAILSSTTTLFPAALLNNVCGKPYQSILIGLLTFSLLWFIISNNNIVAYSNAIVTERLNRRMLLFRNLNQTRKTPTLAIVTAITPDFVNGSIARVSVANKRNYAEMHDYEFILDAAIDRTRSGAWSKIITLHAVMHARPDIEWFWWLDLDAFILEKQIDIYDQVTKMYQFGLEKEHNITKDLLMSDDCYGPDSFNAGSFLIRNSQWSKNAMRTVYEKQYWDRHYHNEEQDAMFWLYKNHKDWGRQVQIFPMRLANSFANLGCGEKSRVVYQDGDMVVHYAGYRDLLPRIWSSELKKWRNKRKLLDDTEVDVFVK